MKLISAFFQLIRWPNLVFIVITQCLFFFCVFDSILFSSTTYHNIDFILLVTASLLVAAGGYIINDYFDRQIDAVNKPGKVVVDKILKRRWAIIWHLVFSFAGFFISLYISFKSGNWLIVLGNSFCIFLLWFYSTTFKKKLLVGNIIISALTAWVVLVIYFYYTGGFNSSNIKGWQVSVFTFDIRKFFKFTILYAGFAFMLSLIREVVKDLEDMNGDAKFDCRTMPIVWGVPATKVFAAVWIVVSIGALVIVQFYAWQSGWWVAAVYCFFVIILPLAMILEKLYKASTQLEYHRISNMIKYVMLSGILSMIFFKFFA